MTRNFAILLLATSALIAQPVQAQRRAEGARAGGGRMEAPRAPEARARPNEEPRVEHLPNGRENKTPHVANGTWFGHAAPNDARFHLATPFAHGRFSNIGPTHHLTFDRVVPAERELFLPGGFGFEVAQFDWPLAADWCWTCSDDFVVYEDPDHLGWYLLYNLATQTYVHAQYLGI